MGPIEPLKNLYDIDQMDCPTADTVPFSPSVQSHVMAEKSDHFKIHLNSKENLLAIWETPNL